MRSNPWLKLMILIASVGVIGVATIAIGQIDNEAVTPPGQPYAGLISKAERNGDIRIIVGLRDSYQPRAGLSAEAEDAERLLLTKAAEDAFIAKLSGYDVAVTRRIDLFPIVGLKVDAAALRVIASWPEVTSVVEDRPIPAFSEGP